MFRAKKESLSFLRFGIFHIFYVNKNYFIDRVSREIIISIIKGAFDTLWP